MEYTQIKQFISKQLDLPVEFIQDNAFVSTLCVVSNYFSRMEAEKDKDFNIIDTSQLKLNVLDLHTIEDKKVKIDISMLFKYRTDAVYYEDSIGDDGLTYIIYDLLFLLIDIEEFTGISLSMESDNLKTDTVSDLIKLFSNKY